MKFEELLADCLGGEDIATDDILGSVLPLMRAVIETHRHNLVAPLEGTQDLLADGVRLWFEDAKRKPARSNLAEVNRIEIAGQAAVEIVAESRRTTDIGAGVEEIVRSEIATRGAALTRPVYLPGYVSWEHELGHHDPLTDVFSLGLILASIACRLNLNDPADVELFVVHRRNLFSLNSRLHPVLAQAILRLTELERRRRPQDLAGLLRALENYRDQPVDFEIDLARVPGFQTRDRRSRQEVVLTSLQERLFDLSRRNSLLSFRATLSSVNLTQASIPLLLDIRNIREDQILVWNAGFQEKLIDGKPIPLNRYLNFTEALYLPSLLERIIADARRDNQEYGFAQLRLVACFLSWTNLKESPVERFISPLVLIQVRLTKTKGIRDTYHLEALSTEAELNPVVRHQFRRLYNIELPETIDLAATNLDSLFDYLTAKIGASEPAVTLTKIDRPRIDLVHEKAKRRVDQYRRSARVAGRGVRSYLDTDYSYDPANFHPLGCKLFSTWIRTPGSQLRDILQEHPRPREFAAPDPVADSLEKERSFFQLRDTAEENPYLWHFDLCSMTLANLRYRRMSLVRDYEAIQDQQILNSAFDTMFSLSPRPVGRELPPIPSLEDRFDVVPCDPTQATAIAEARLGTSYIIQGPPGTGKSQTITNLIADFVARGQRVLFVCEKRAAIDVVFARLRQSGLGPLCSLIHDSQTDKKEFILDLKQTYEMFTADNAPRRSNGLRTRLLGKLHGTLQPLQAYEEAMESEAPLAKLPLRQFLDRCVRLKAARPSLSPEDAERLPLYCQWWENRDRLANLDVTLRELEPKGILAHHPLRRLKPELAPLERPMETVGTAVQRTLVQLRQLVTTLGECGIASDQWNSLHRVNDLLAYATLIAPLIPHGNLTLVDPATDRAGEFEKSLAQLRQQESEFGAAKQANAAWRQKLMPGDLQTAWEQARGWEGKFFLWAWLSPDWWRLRKVLRASYDFSAHAVRPTWIQILSSLQKEYSALAAFEQRTSEIKARMGGEFEPARLAEKVQSVRQQVARMPDWVRRIHTTLLKSPKSAEIVACILNASEAAGECNTELNAILTDFDQLPLDLLRDELQEIASSVRQIPQALVVLGELADVPQEIGRMLREFPFDMTQAEAAVAHRTWEEVTRVDRAVRNFEGSIRRRLTHQVENHYENWMAANATEICFRAGERFREHLRVANLPNSQLSEEQREFKKSYLQGRKTLEHEFGKSMRYKAIRELVDGDAGQVIRDLKPVWLMSPLSVSDTLPLVSDFVDVVIFDEASQVPLEESIPSLFRGPQTIVVGDEMQLPPTDFFSTKQDNEDEELVIEEGEDRIRYELSSDSFLSHAAKNLPATMLGWHYRSRSESLISFSNWAFYDGRLLTVPEHQRLGSSDGSSTSATDEEENAVATAESLLRCSMTFHFLANGVYDKRRNRAEADYIAQLVMDLLRRQQGLSIGVVAFSEAQQTEIESALDRLAAEDDELRRLLDEEYQREVDGQFVGLLVKNLENIQGDERDVIILSICYGPGPNGKMLMNFGPINKSGGEKRLNVAFSRAKQYMAVVSSIRHGHITNEYNAGANCLKGYLRYSEAMSNGEIQAAQRVLNGITRWREHRRQIVTSTEDAVVEQLGLLLRDRGFIVELGVGQSHFRVDLAVRRTDDTDYRLGILVDTQIQYEQTEPLERDVMRPRLLRLFGWRIETVLAKDWYENADREFEQIVSILEGRGASESHVESDLDDDEDEFEDREDTNSEFEAESTLDNADDVKDSDEHRGHNPEKSDTSAPTEIIDVGHDVVSPAGANKKGASNKRRFEFQGEGSQKFWEIFVEGAQHTVQFGRIGTKGQTQTKSFANAAAAVRDADRLVNQKLRKGYRETTG